MKIKTTVLLLFLVQEAIARTWRDIQTHDSSPRDVTRSQQFEDDPLKFSAMPTISPKGSTTGHPTRTPTPPTRKPTTAEPTKSPTESPTTTGQYPENPPPRNPPRGYFNYDVRDTNPYGPGYPALVYGDNGFEVTYQNNGWDWTLTPDDYYWDEFGSNGFGPWSGALASRDMENNQCGNVGMQSPIDIRLSGVACIEHHQIRTRVSDWLRHLTSMVTSSMSLTNNV
jgi:hypothetical protein